MGGETGADEAWRCLGAVERCQVGGECGRLLRFERDEDVRQEWGSAVQQEEERRCERRRTEWSETDTDSGSGSDSGGESGKGGGMQMERREGKRGEGVWWSGG